ncbi:hypothetical protein [Paraclostridium sordellii]|uniref:hypothetical protein n=1 Tax=Paraclostridium sordellii TaxID=1505 RepID=UPI000E4F16A6|nr:hypothetical protein [Paeniclostridium sordellii]RGX06265.1 hypothetical protein DWV40_11485 [Paeniclostridium sordellii]
MDILIRNVNKNISKKIDSLSKEEGYTSRNDFLSKKIEDIAFENEKYQLEKDYLNTMNLLSEVVKNHTNILGSFMDQFVIDAEEAYNIDLSYTDIKSKLKKESINLHFGEEKSEIKIRELPSNVVTRIDEISKERNLSRNEFLIKYLSQLTYSNSVKLINEKYDYTIEKVLGLLEFSNRVLTLFHEENYIDTSNFYEGDHL